MVGLIILLIFVVAIIGVVVYICGKGAKAAVDEAKSGNIVKALVIIGIIVVILAIII